MLIINCRIYFCLNPTYQLPEENSYIKTFHSILEREVIKRFDFESYYEAKLTLAAYMDHYNIKRKHGSLKRKTPMQIWDEYYQTLSSNKHLTDQLSEDLSRVLSCVDTGLAPNKSGDRLTLLIG